MKTKPSILTEEDIELAYGLMTEFFGSMKADTVYFDVTHPSY